MPAVPWPWPGRAVTRSAEALALAVLSLVACVGGDRVGAVQLARQAEQHHRPACTARRPGCAATSLTTVLIEAGDLAAAERVCAAGLAGARDAGDLWSLGNLLEKMVVLDLGSGRYADAAAHLREASPDRLADRLHGKAARRPGLLRVPVRRDRARRRGRHGVGRGGRAPGARGVLGPVAPGSARGLARSGRNPCARPGRRSDRTGRGRPRSAARR